MINKLKQTSHTTLNKHLAPDSNFFLEKLGKIHREEHKEVKIRDRRESKKVFVLHFFPE